MTRAHRPTLHDVISSNDGLTPYGITPMELR